MESQRVGHWVNNNSNPSYKWEEAPSGLWYSRAPLLSEMQFVLLRSSHFHSSGAAAYSKSPWAVWGQPLLSAPPSLTTPPSSLNLVTLSLGGSAGARQHIFCFVGSASVTPGQPVQCLPYPLPSFSALDYLFFFFFSFCGCCLVAKFYLTLCDPMHCSSPGSSVHGILQARTLEWVAISFSRGSSWHRDQTCIFFVSCIGRQVLYQLCCLGSP